MGILFGLFAVFPVYAAGPDITFFAEPSTIEKGESTTLAWFSPNAYVCNLLGRPEAPSGLRSITPERTNDYTISCQGNSKVNSDTVDGVSAKTVVVTVIGTDPVSSNSGNNGNGSNTNNGTDPKFSAACVVNPASARIGELVRFDATSVGGEGTLYYAWSGGIDGGGQKIFKKFTSGGTKTATLVVTDGRGIAVTTACNVFIEPGETVSSVSPQASSGTPPGEINNETVNENGDEQDETSALVGAVAEGGSGGLLTIFIIAIIIAMAVLFYFFIWAKQKKTKKDETLKEQKVLT